MDIQIGSKSVLLEIDTDSGLSIVSENIFEKKLADYPLKQTDIKLKSYSGQKKMKLWVSIRCQKNME